MVHSTTTETILIADSGATKTDWCLTCNGAITEHITGKGISPLYQTEQEIADEIRHHLYPVLKERPPHAVHFYGSGCTPGKIALVSNAIHRSFPIEAIHVYSDLMAATHSLCGDDAGIVCIMGTGSNSCEWNGSAILNQVSPLGYILGDEGSGAALGKQLVGDALKHLLTPGLREKLLEEYDLTPALIIDRVYRQPFPSRFLANFAPFLLRHIDDKSIRKIVTDGFSAFFERNVMQYNIQKYRVHFVGSIAWHFSDILKEVAAEKKIDIGKIEQSPMNGLIKFHQ